MKRFALTFLLSSVLLATCGATVPQATPYPDEVPWEVAVELLHSGQVVSVVQLHSLEVTLELEDGTSVKTIEPQIDEIFDEVARCGEACAQIVLATE